MQSSKTYQDMCPVDGTGTILEPRILHIVRYGGVSSNDEVIIISLEIQPTLVGQCENDSSLSPQNIEKHLK